jgi:PIN domain nuclease of toxin-antitoxin system
LTRRCRKIFFHRQADESVRLLLDTQVLIALIDERSDRLAPHIVSALSAPDATFCVSVASLWEISIKTRLGKLRLATELELLPELVEVLGLELVPIVARHVLATVDPEPPTRDPFDRLLLAQCAVEGARLATMDRALVGHPIAFASV